MTKSAYIIIAANLLPLFMTMGGAWSLNEILPLYWSESAVIGFFTILKILSSGGQVGKLPGGSPYSVPAMAGKLFLCAFFTMHFGMFMFVHGTFLFSFVINGMNLGKATGDPTNTGHWLQYLGAVKWGIASLFAGHAASFIMNFLLAGEFRNASPLKTMSQPYPRIIIMHLTILLGAFVSVVMPATSIVLVFFIAAKIYVDVQAHRKEHARAAGQPAAPGPVAQ